MLRIVHERHEKKIRCRFLAEGVIPCMHSFILTLFDTAQNGPSSLYTQRHSGWDAGTQAQGGETPCYTSIYGMCRHSDSPWPGVGQETGR